MNLGFLGVGPMAVHHAEVAVDLGHSIVAGLATSTQSMRWSQFFIRFPDAKFIPTVDLLLKLENVEGIVVCLPWDVTPDLLSCLLEYEKPMLIEKPVHLNSGKLAKIVAKASVTSNKLVGMNRRFYSSTKALADRIAKGGLKAADIIISEKVANLIVKFGNNIADHYIAYSACHILDLAEFLFGPLELVSSVSYDEPGYVTRVKYYTGLFRSGDLPITFAINADDPVQVGLRCRFDDHTHWQLSPIEELRIFEGYEIRDPTPNDNIRRYFPREVGRVTVGTRYKPGFYGQMSVFSKGDYTKAANLSDAIRLLSLIDSIKSASPL